METAPADATHWSTQGLVDKHGISHQTVAEIWRAFGQAVASGQLKVSPGPELVEKIRYLVALFMNLPVAGAVVCARREAPDPGARPHRPHLPMLPTTPQRATHDYERNGTCDLFAALT